MLQSGPCYDQPRILGSVDICSKNLILQTYRSF